MKRPHQKQEEYITAGGGCLTFILVIILIFGAVIFGMQSSKQGFFNILNRTADVGAFVEDVKASYEKNITSPDFAVPLEGNITSPFGERINPNDNTTTEKHTGIDIDTNLSLKVTASADGEVQKVGFDERFGNFVILRHNKTYSTCYAHLEEVKVTEKEKIKKGRLVGIAGETGNATGKHLHFEIRKGDERVDPQKYIFKNEQR